MFHDLFVSSFRLYDESEHSAREDLIFWREEVRSTVMTCAGIAGKSVARWLRVLENLPSERVAGSLLE